MKVTRTIAGIPPELERGWWVVWRHELAERDNITPQEWRARLRVACEDAGIECVIHIIPKHDLTVVWNKAIEPPFDQVQDSIDRVLNLRWREIG
jgi:hypothetical protein